MENQPAGPAGRLVVIVGPSGVGKTTLLRWLRERDPEMHFARSATTRPRRPGESDEEYAFVTGQGFDDLVRAGKFLEWSTVHSGARYGTPLDDIVEEAHKVIGCACPWWRRSTCTAS